MSPSLSRDGYLRVIFRVNKNERSRTIHSLVLEAFHGPRPDGMVVSHLNHVRDDNNLTNLIYTTVTDNIRYSYQQGRYEKRKRIGRERLTDAQVRLIRSGKLSDGELAEKFGFIRSFINKVRRHKNYKWVE
jgi:hypothetical protein